MLSDSDRAIDGLMCIDIYDSPCIRLTCGVHLMDNLKHHVNNSEILLSIQRDIFGYKDAKGVHNAGLVDAIDKNEFERQLVFKQSQWPQEVIDWYVLIK